MACVGSEDLEDGVDRRCDVERRKFSRARFVGPATVKAEGRMLQVEVENISLHGALLVTPDPVDIGEEVRIYLPDDLSEQTIEASAVVVRSEDGFTGVDFREMSSHAFGLLRQVVSACSPNPDQPGEELRAHLKSFCQPDEE
ncbi:MAG: PilZ domain-containing protein [Planctomycetota bacterium]